MAAVVDCSLRCLAEWAVVIPADGEAGRSWEAAPGRRGPVISHRMPCQRDRVIPPSTRMFWPVMYPAASDSRKATVAATSSTLP
jgi:hypothetical protein